MVHINKHTNQNVKRMLNMSQLNGPYTSPYMTTPALCKRYHCSVRTLYRWQERTDHPMPEPAIRPSGSHNLWLAKELEEWEQSLMKPKAEEVQDVEKEVEE